ncbi:beta-carotene 3-hydroxylase 1, chloroplastic-like [Panicum miliaceum]|uniref:beta-carotene 3-hydroxylase n=1 Tax=Panicum miliaceum TaxID=4540 RepID=A0A3L6PP34_PANMI|nr:beta-carotene 3-hydroxylase 1, chloroplastic-like [Panicum miliaceum]
MSPTTAPRDGPFELNDVFAIVNAVPAMSLLAYGFFNRGLIPASASASRVVSNPSPFIFHSLVC